MLGLSRTTKSVVPLGHLRNRYLLFGDLATLPATLLLAFVIRFEGFAWPPGLWRTGLVFLLLSLPAKAFVMWRLGLYTRMWRYASVQDVEVIGYALAGSAA